MASALSPEAPSGVTFGLLVCSAPADRGPYPAKSYRVPFLYRFKSYGGGSLADKRICFQWLARCATSNPAFGIIESTVLSELYAHAMH